MYAVREDRKPLLKELCCIGSRGPVKERDMRELCDAVYGNKHVLFAAGALHFGAVDVNEAERRFFKLSVPSWHMRCGLSADSVTLQAWMQGAAAELGRAVSKSCPMRSSSDRCPCLLNAVSKCSCS